MNNKPPEQVTVYNTTPNYANSNRMKREMFKASGTPASARPPQPPSAPEEPERDGFFKATLKQACRNALTNVVDPAIRNFLDDTITDLKNSLIWGKDAKRFYYRGQTDYRQISTGGRPGLPAPAPSQQMTAEDHKWQKYEMCSKPTQEEIYKIMSMLYRTLRNAGKVTLAQYYQFFGERYDFNDEAWGWTSLPEMSAQYFGNGYHIRMPKIEILDSEIRR